MQNICLLFSKFKNERKTILTKVVDIIQRDTNSEFMIFNEDVAKVVMFFSIEKQQENISCRVCDKKVSKGNKLIIFPCFHFCHKYCATYDWECSVCKLDLANLPSDCSIRFVGMTNSAKKQMYCF